MRMESGCQGQGLSLLLHYESWGNWEFGSDMGCFSSTCGMHLHNFWHPDFVKLAELYGQDYECGSYIINRW